MNFNMKLRRKSIIDVKNRASFKNNGAQISTAIKAISFVKENEQISTPVRRTSSLSSFGKDLMK